MTAIAGWIDEELKCVWMGADSGGTDGHSIHSRVDRKVFSVGDYLIAGTGSYRMIQLLMYGDHSFNLSKLKPPRKKEDMHKFMVTKFVPLIRQIFAKGGFSSSTEGEEAFYGGFLVGIKDSLFCVETDFHVGEYARYVAGGSGHDFCMGALSVCWDCGFPPEEALESALNCAALYCTSVQGPNIIINNFK